MWSERGPSDVWSLSSSWIYKRHETSRFETPLYATPLVSGRSWRAYPHVLVWNVHVGQQRSGPDLRSWRNTVEMLSTVWILEFDETVPLCCSRIYQYIEARDRLFWPKITRWGFQPYSANLSWSRAGLGYCFLLHFDARAARLRDSAHSMQMIRATKHPVSNMFETSLHSRWHPPYHNQSSLKSDLQN